MTCKICNQYYNKNSVNTPAITDLRITIARSIPTDPKKTVGQNVKAHDRQLNRICIRCLNKLYKNQELMNNLIRSAVKKNTMANENRSNVEAKEIAKKVKAFFKQEGIKVSIKTLTTRGKTEKPIWIQIFGNMSNTIRLGALKAMEVDMESVLNLSNIHYGNITDKWIHMVHLHWEKFLQAQIIL